MFCGQCDWVVTLSPNWGVFGKATNPSKLLIFQRSKSSANVRRWLANAPNIAGDLRGAGWPTFGSAPAQRPALVGQRSPALPGIAPAQRWPLLPQRYTAFCGVAGSVV